MKKIITTLILCFLTNVVLAQIYPVYELDKKEVYGYVTLQLVEKSNRKTSSYIVGLLDINLNVVTQSKFEAPSNNRMDHAVYNGSHVYFEMSNYLLPTPIESTAKRVYFLYDLAKNTVSAPYEFKDYKKPASLQGRFAIGNKGFGILLQDKKSLRYDIIGISNDNKRLYKKRLYEDVKKKHQQYMEFLDAKNDILALRVAKSPNKKFKDFNDFLLLFDTKAGKVVKEVSFDNEELFKRIINGQMIDNKMMVYGNTYQEEDDMAKGFTDGVFMAEVSMGGEVLELQERNWLDFQGFFKIKENGRVEGQGFIVPKEFVKDKESGHIIIAGEYIRGAPGQLIVGDIILMDMDKNFNLSQIFEEEKPISAIEAPLIRSKGVRRFKNSLNYDYNFSNTLKEGNGLIFVYSKYRAEMFSIGSLSHNVIAYENGKFTSTDLEGKIGGWMKKKHLVLSPSKPGYVLISRVSKGLIEDFRLEKVDF